MNIKSNDKTNQEPSFRAAFLIPVYRHGSTLEGVVSSIENLGLHIIVADDGNGDKDKEYIRKVQQKRPSLVTVVTLPKNRGKGAACRAGVLKARDMGFTHVFQVDSDGQHDTSRASAFLDAAKRNPGAVICGMPEYDESAPSLRLNGRKVANAWVHIVTLSNEIKDALIGFRVYPVEPYVRLLRHHAVIDNRMAYDIDILVHLSWAGLPVISLPVKVSYPKDGVSNFRAVRDNARISLCYTRLCLGMIARLPVLLVRARRRGADYVHGTQMTAAAAAFEFAGDGNG